VPVRRARPVATGLAVLAACVLLAAGIDASMAQPFGAPRAPAPPPPEGVVAWLLVKQAEFYRALSGTIRAAKADGSALWALMGLSFAYGVFHAAGPGHGKAVISSYVVANDETWRRGVALSFASAMLQAVVAVLVVGVAAGILGATARTMGEAVRVIEIVSYALIALMGARLLWVKGRAFVQALRAMHGAPAHAQHHGHGDHAPHHPDGHDHGHVHHDGAHRDHHHHDDHAGHSHGPSPDQLAGPGGWKRGLVAILAVGLRPCSGAILVLVFALAQGLLWAGIASTFVMGLGTAITVAAIATLAAGAKSLAGRLAGTHAGYGSLALRGIEVAAAAIVLAFGLLLLLGYMANERLFAL
jgi:nickel/cobalt transporter (NicO) family protein